VHELQIGDWNVAASVAEWIEIAAIVVIAAAVVIAFVVGVRARLSRSGADPATVFKRTIANGLLIGLDLLIAADVIRTVTLEPTLENVAALGLLVVVRTFLAWTLVVEVDGRWPWQRDQAREPSDSITADEVAT
jgi:uncharacterized membrane protein